MNDGMNQSQTEWQNQRDNDVMNQWHNNDWKNQILYKRIA